MKAHHTGSFRISRLTKSDIEEAVVGENGDGCRFYDPRRKRQVKLELRGGGIRLISVMRAVYVLHTGEDLAERDEAVHTCGNSGDAGTEGCCVNGDHIEKATEAQRQAVALRTRIMKRKAS